MLTSSTQLQNRSFDVVERTRTSSKCQKMKYARAKRAKFLFFTVKYANLWRSCCCRRRGCVSSLIWSIEWNKRQTASRWNEKENDSLKMFWQLYTTSPGCILPKPLQIYPFLGHLSFVVGIRCDESAERPVTWPAEYSAVFKCDCLVYEMLFIQELKPSLNTQSDSISAKLFV